MLAALLISSCAVFAQDRTGKKLAVLEKRVTKVEKRVTRLEGGAARPAVTPPEKQPANPITVYFKNKKQVVGRDKLGIKLYLEFENTSTRDLSAFNGMLVFKNEAGAVIWSRPYGHSEPLGRGEKVEVSMGILSDQTKEYLKFVKARGITVSLQKQETYAAE